MQAQAMIQMLTLKMTKASFDYCMSKPGNALSRSEKTCLEQFAGRYIDATALIQQKMNGPGQ